MDNFDKRIWNDKWREDDDEFMYNIDRTRHELIDVSYKSHEEWVKNMKELMERKRG